jgi:lipoprotein-releasing system ATP-binding protein
MTLFSTRALTKSYDGSGKRVEVLRGIDLDIEVGQTISIAGSSGVGKSTLLNILGTLDRPTSGELLFMGEDLLSYDDKKLAAFRNSSIGFVFQFHHLLPEFTAAENVMLPALIAGSPAAEARVQAEGLLADVGLSSRLEHKPGELSGGEQQRTAIVRALIRSPRILLADEPTGNLDTRTGGEVFDLLMELNEARQTAVVVVTHNETLAGRMSRRLKMVDGQLYEAD